MKYTLLELTQRVLTFLEADEVNSISDTTEALQVSSIIEDCYFALISNKTIPEHQEMVRLTAASDSEFPSHLKYPNQVSFVKKVWYDVSPDNTFEYKELCWLEPEDFLSITDRVRNNFSFSSDKKGATKLRILNNQMPTYYTSFDDEWIVCDSWDMSSSSTLMSSKTRALVIKTPVWEPHQNDFVPDIDDNYFPLLLAEAKVIAANDLHGNADSVTDRQATRIRAGVQTRKRKNAAKKDKSTYGR